MKQKSDFQDLFNNIVSHIDERNNQHSAQNFLNLSEQIEIFLENTKEIQSGLFFDTSRIKLKKLASRIKRTSKKQAINKIDGFRCEIKDLIAKIIEDQSMFIDRKQEIIAQFESDLKRITTNIKLDFEFLFDRYIRRVDLNIGSKIFDLIQLEDDYEIKVFFLDNIFTCKRISNDLVELSFTFAGQINSLMEKLGDRIGLKQYETLAQYSEIIPSKSKNFKTDFNMQEKIRLRSIFSKDEDIAREILSGILFSAIGDNSDSLYLALKDRHEDSKFSDGQIKKYIKKMEVHLSEFINKLNIEIDVKIKENSYPLISIFNKSQDEVFAKLVHDFNKIEFIQKELELLGENITVKQDTSNYELLKDILS